MILAGSTVGLLAGTMGRLYGSSYYALGDPRTPLRYAVLRVLLTTILGYLCALPLPRLAGIEPRFGVVGLTASAGVAAWIEFFLLRRGMNRRIGVTGLKGRFLVTLWVAALASAGVAYAVSRLLGDIHPIPLALGVVATMGIGYLGLTSAAGIAESKAFAGPLVRRLTGR
jgi:putative peptidoglycan lipid II flippase